MAQFRRMIMNPEPDEEEYFNGYLFHQRRREQYTNTGPSPLYGYNYLATPNNQNQGSFSYIPDVAPYSAKSSCSGNQINQPGGFLHFIPEGEGETSAASLPVADRTRPQPQSKKGKARNTKWETQETRILIHEYNEQYDKLKETKSSRGKKIVWDTIYMAFTMKYRDVGMYGEFKSLSQVKEKWKTLFDRYKEIKDNSKATGRGRENFEFFEEIDTFMGFSDKVQPKYVRQTSVLEDQAETDKNEDSKGAKSNEEKCLHGKREGEERPARKKPKKSSELEFSLVEMLENQQSAFEKSEENDRKVLHGIMNFQADSEKRHQEFMISVLGKLGDMFGKK